MWDCFSILKADSTQRRVFNLPPIKIEMCGQSVMVGSLEKVFNFTWELELPKFPLDLAAGLVARAFALYQSPKVCFQASIPRLHRVHTRGGSFPNSTSSTCDTWLPHNQIDQNLPTRQNASPNIKRIRTQSGIKKGACGKIFSFENTTVE